METKSQPPPGNGHARTNYILGGLSLVFVGLGGLFLVDLWGHPVVRQKIPLVDPGFLENKPWRQAYPDLLKAKEDMSDFDCYSCHERNKPLPLHLDEKQNVIIPKEHENIKMGHGSHNRNNLCYNCHNESNLLTLAVRDGRDLKFSDSVQLCGSCHGPTYRDWEAGAHGRTSGYWDRSKGQIQRLICANCHNPHSPSIPTRSPAPGPHPLRETVITTPQPTH